MLNKVKGLVNRAVVTAYLDKILSIFNRILTIFGFRLLSQNQTLAFLEKSQIAYHLKSQVNLPEVVLHGKQEVIFKATLAESRQGFVWSFNASDVSARQLMYGAIKVDQNVLCTDFDHSSFYKLLIKTQKRLPKVTDTLIAPWAQFNDGITFGGYYDFVFLVFAKLCRIKEAMASDEFANAVIAYPLFHTEYEQEYLNMLDVDPESVVDSNIYNVKFNKVILGNSGHWFYPNIADIHALQKYVSSNLQISKTQNNRVYISRATRRKITNEPELIVLLKEFGFIIIEDRFRTIAKQVEIYKNASFIIGPHGASFSNVIWCEPGTHLFELFSPNYMPGHFLYLATLMGLEYTAYHNGEPKKNLSYSASLTEDITVSIKDLKDCLTALFNQIPHG